MPDASAPKAPLTAANSASCGSPAIPATPIPPTTLPFERIPSLIRSSPGGTMRYSGMPPASTLAGFASSGCCFPVTMPLPQPVLPNGVQGFPLTDVAGAMYPPGLNGTFSAQPRFVFSMPYSGAFGASATPGGKCTPLMKRTVREESGAMLLLKKAAVRARPTARSSFAGSAFGLRKSASGFPARSTTATVMLSLSSEVAAAATMAVTSSLPSAPNATAVPLPTPPSTH